MSDIGSPAGRTGGPVPVPTLDDLPEKLRVHALARLLGRTSREVLATLAELGVEARSAQSSVLRKDAERVVTALLPDATAAEVPPEPGSAAGPAATAESATDPATAPAGGRGAAGGKPASIVESATDAAGDKPESTGEPAADPAGDAPASAAEAATASTGEPTADLVSTSTTAPAADVTDAPDVATDPADRARVAALPVFGAVEPAAPVTDAGAAAPVFGAATPLFQAPAPVTRTRRRSRSAQAEEQAEEQAEAASVDASTPADADPGDPDTPDTAGAESSDAPGNADTADTADTGADTDDDEGGARRRRRRGRRGRGRGRGGDDAGDTAENGDDSDARSGADDADDADDTDESDETDADDTADDADDTAEDTEDAEDSADGSGGSRRRRRRRRRRGAGDDDTAGAGDPPNTVTKVRAPRERDSRDGRDTDDDGVQSVRGSTRLEAKRQRRRDGRDAGRRRVPILSEAEFLARRESVDRAMVVRERGDRVEIAVLEDDVLVEHFVTGGADGAGNGTGKSIVGNVYLGRVQNVLPSMEAAFIDIGRGRNAVLYAGEVDWDAAGLGGKARRIEQALSSGDSVLVQVTKDPIGHKGARLTTQVSLAGRFLVYVPSGGAAGISRKLPDVERKRLKDMLKEIVPSEAGVIIRTASEGVSQEALERDVRRLQAQWEVVKDKAEATGPGRPKAPSLLYEEPDLLIKVVRDQFNEDFSKLVVAGDDAWDTVAGYIGHVAPELVERLHRHVGPTDVFAEYRIDEQLLKALDRKVWLPSGGTLVIDRTEAMTVIDVNTGKFTGSGGNLEETVTRNNLEAAEEVVRQLRLRDVGGIIVIDFIDMVLEANRDLVLRRLTECLARDRTRHQVAEVTSLGLVQMTRKRVGGGLLEHFSTTCEHCRGRGVVVNSEPVTERVETGRGPEREGRRSRGGRRRGSEGENGRNGRSGDTGRGPAEVAEPVAKPVSLPPGLRPDVGPEVAGTPADTASEVAAEVAPDQDVEQVPGEAVAVAVTDTPAFDVATPEEHATSSGDGRANGSANGHSNGSGNGSGSGSGGGSGSGSGNGTTNGAGSGDATDATDARVAPVSTAVQGSSDSPEGSDGPGGSAAPADAPTPRTRRRAVRRTAGAPTPSGGEAAVAVVTVAATEAAPAGEEPPAGVVPQPEPTATSRPRRARRAASRPAGPPAPENAEPVPAQPGGDPV